MSWTRHSRGRSGYHHGNLKEALIEAALHLIATHGPLGFTVAEAARTAGVSPAAPYRHYRDRDSLLAEIAKRGFALFGAELERAWNQGRPEPIGAFSNVGRAYLAFARNHQGYYAAMFESGGLSPDNADLQQASDAAFATLRQAAEAVCSRLPKDRRPPPLMMALHVWALAHGIASLFGRGGAAVRKLPMSPEDLLEAGFLVYLQGVGMGDQAYAPTKPNAV
jgi:AcrR family transcriptional regulator